MRRFALAAATVLVVATSCSATWAITLPLCVDCEGLQRKADEEHVLICYLDDELFHMEAYRDRLLDLLQEVQRDIVDLLQIPDNRRFSGWKHMWDETVARQKGIGEALISISRQIKQAEQEREACEWFADYWMDKINLCTGCQGETFNWMR